MKRLILITLLAFGFATANAQFYRLRYDSVEVVSKFKLGTVTDGNSTDAILLRRDNGGVYKIAQSNFATTSSLSNYVALTGNQTVAGQKTFTSSPQVNDAIYINNRTNTSGNSTVSYRTGGSTDWVHGTGISGAGSTSDWSLWKNNGTTAINVSYANNAVTFNGNVTAPNFITAGSLQANYVTTSAGYLNPSSANNSAIYTANDGTIVARQVVDNKSPLVVQSLNGTGDITQFVQGASVVAKVPLNGTPVANEDLITKGYFDTILATSNVVSVSGTSATAQSGKVYQTLNSSLTTITLPASPVNGATVIVNGIGAGKWRIQHGSGTVLIKGVGGFTTVAGLAKGVETSDQYGTLSLRYESTTNVWVVTSQNGSIAAY